MLIIIVIISEIFCKFRLHLLQVCLQSFASQCRGFDFWNLHSVNIMLLERDCICVGGDCADCAIRNLCPFFSMIQILWDTSQRLESKYTENYVRGDAETLRVRHLKVPICPIHSMSIKCGKMCTGGRAQQRGKRDQHEQFEIHAKDSSSMNVASERIYNHVPKE